MLEANPVIIVGGGLAGLACAIELQQGGLNPLILEDADAVGGRVRTDRVAGFLLDRGFQVYLSAYPEAGKLLDLAALDLRSFRSGALVFSGGKLRRVMDVFRHPQYLLGSALARIGSVADKLRVAKLRFQRRRMQAASDPSTAEFLTDFGFSQRMIDGFFRAFYGGIFLERELRTSSRMFQFTFQMFSQGAATLPNRGMQAIPDQLAARLPTASIRLNSPVAKVDATSVQLESGQRIAAAAVVLATDSSTTQRFLPAEPNAQAPAWRAVTGLYFSAPVSPLKEAIIALNGDGTGWVNNVCVISDVAPGYAPAGQSLISVSVLGVPTIDALEVAVVTELHGWFGPQVAQWQHLRTYRIPYALPEQPVTPLKQGVELQCGIYLCGDHCTSASIEGAIVSGMTTAAAILGQAVKC
jgi:phytoene dehydrogenase-like protein